MKIYAEFGIGNGSICSTEFEEGENEFRVPRFVLPEKIQQIYLRFWIGQTVFILSSKDGFLRKRKTKKKLKLLFGVGGEGSMPESLKELGTDVESG